MKREGSYRNGLNHNSDERKFSQGSPAMDPVEPHGVRRHGLRLI